LCIAALIAAGLANGQIAKCLSIEPGSVEYSVGRIRRRHGLAWRMRVAVSADEHGLYRGYLMMAPDWRKSLRRSRHSAELAW